jgi:hypothetical protein
VKDLIKDYLQLDNVNFFFGTGSSIHLGAVSIQNIPEQVKSDIYATEDNNLKESFLKAIQKLQQEFRLENSPVEKDKPFTDNRSGWTFIDDGDYIRNYVERECAEGEGDEPAMHYGEIYVAFETLMNYLIASSYKASAEHSVENEEQANQLISALKKSLFHLCDVHECQTRDADLKRIEKLGLKEAFEKNKYIFHEKFIKSLLQRPLNLKRANIFTCNYDLAFEYSFDNLGVKYIDGFSGFHHRYFKPETFNYDIFYPGSTTAGKVQRIEKVVRYFKLHGSISWVKDEVNTPNNIYGIEEMPLELIKCKEQEKDKFDFGNLIIYPSAVKKSYTLDLPYSELIRQFAYHTSLPQTVLFTVGYSFCDEHFNDIIYQALSNPSFTLIIIDYNGSVKNAEIRRLKELNDPRIIILEGPFFGDFLAFSTLLMPDFQDTSRNDEVASTLNSLLNKAK